jgi:hypothetical protein
MLPASMPERALAAKFMPATGDDGFWRRRRIRGTLTFCLGLALLSGGYVAVTGSRAISRLIPPTSRLFAQVGLPINSLGLDFKAVTSSLLDDGDMRVLAVEGSVTNVESAMKQVPDLRLAVMAGTDQELYSWTIPSPKARLAAGESVVFHARLVAPPAGGERMKLTFAAKSDASLGSKVLK